MQDHSGGEKQRIIIAKMFFSNCDLILLDEVFSNIDMKNAVKIIEEIKAFKEERNVVFVSHNKQVVEQLADQCYDIQQN